MAADGTPANGVSATAEVVVAAPLAEVFSIVAVADPPSFYPKFGPLPAVVSVSEQTGPFTEVGSSRLLHLSDGGHVRETVVTVDDPHFHSYRLTGFEKLFGHLVTGALAEWRFSSEADGSRISWTYTFFPVKGRGVIVRAIIRLFWAPYMRKVLPPIGRAAGPLA